MKFDATQKRRLALAFVAFSVTVIVLLLGVGALIYTRVMGSAGYSRQIATHLPNDVYAMVALRNPTSLAVFLTRTDLLDAWEENADRSNDDDAMLREVLSQHDWAGFDITSPLGCGLRLDEAYAVMGCTAAVSDGEEAVATLEDVAEELSNQGWRAERLGSHEARVSDAGTTALVVVSGRLYLLTVEATVTEGEALDALEEMLEDMLDAPRGRSLVNVAGFLDAMEMSRYTVASIWISGAIIREAEEELGAALFASLEDLDAISLALGYEDDTVELSGRAVFDAQAVQALDFGAPRSARVFGKIPEPASVVAHVSVDPERAWEAFAWLSRSNGARRSELEDLQGELEEAFDLSWDEILGTWTGEMGVVVQRLSVSLLWREVESWTAFFGVSGDAPGSALLEQLLDDAEDHGLEVEEEDEDGHPYVRLTEVGGRERFLAVFERRIWVSNDEGTLREVLSGDVRAPLLAEEHNVGLSWALERSVPGVLWFDAGALEGLPLPGEVGRWRDAISDGLDSASIAIETERNLFHLTVQLHARDGDIANIGEMAAPR